MQYQENMHHQQNMQYGNHKQRQVAAHNSVTVGDVERYLFSCFPRRDAEVWDRVGLSIGKRKHEVHRIACALNPTPKTIEEAAKRGCNLLVTHHPLFLNPPKHVSENLLESGLAGASIAAARKADIAIISMHTNLDVSDVAIRLPGELCGWPFEKRLVQPKKSTFLPSQVLRGSYGGVFNIENLSSHKVLNKLARAYDTHIVVQGTRMPSRLSRIAFCSGSLPTAIGKIALKQGIQLIVGGEIGYHQALEIGLAGATLITLGHDSSEEPYAHLLAKLLARAYGPTKIETITEKPLVMSVK